MAAPRIVVVTGATGNIGTKLCAHLSRRGGYELRPVCLNPSDAGGVLTADLGCYDEAWAGSFHGADAVIHLAANANPSAPWSDIERPNLDATLNVLQAARHGGVRRFVYASSNWAMEGYRDGTERLTGDLPPRPTTPYGISKVVGERTGRSFAGHGGASFVALRIGWCLRGTNDRRPVGADPWETAKWVSDRDLCRAFEQAVLAPDIGAAVLNLESDNPGMRWDLSETRRVLGWAPRD